MSTEGSRHRAALTLAEVRVAMVARRMSHVDAGEKPVRFARLQTELEQALRIRDEIRVTMSQETS